MSRFTSVAQSLQRWKNPLLGFVFGQPVLQLVNLITGFFLLRWMSVEHYAQLGVAFAFQATLSVLADLGFIPSILALAGANARDPITLGNYIRSARHFRFYLTIGIGFIFCLCFPIITNHQPWGLSSKLSILASILVAVAVQGWTMYQAPLLANRLVSAVYLPQIIAGVLRLIVCSVLHTLNGLTGVATSWAGTGALTMSGWWIKRSACPLIKEPVESQVSTNSEMLHYLAPLIPGGVFTAFQSQISILIITLFGTTQNIAEIAALGRLGQLFSILGAFNGVVVGPYMAALSPSRFAKRYLQILGATASVGLIFSTLAFSLPGPLLWLLGKNYENLRSEVGWVVIAACLNYIAGVIWTMNSARKWIFTWSTIMYIGCVTSMQVLSVSNFDMSKTSGVVSVGVATALGCLIAHGVTAVIAFNYKNEKSH